MCRAKKPGRAVRKSPEPNEAAMDTLIVHITFTQTTGTYTSKDTSQIKEIDAYVVQFSQKPDPRQAKGIPSNHDTRMTIFLESGANICLGELKQLVNMGLTMNNLIVRAVAGFTLVCQGWLPVKFIV